MKKNLISVIFAVSVLLFFSLPERVSCADNKIMNNIYDDYDDFSYNLIKFNLTSAIIKNFSLQYERVLSQDFTAAISVRVMPELHLPFKDLISNLSFADDIETKDAVKSLLASSFAITPEARYYLGEKKYGRGFYLSLFYRYGKHTLDKAVMMVKRSGGDDIEVKLSGNASAHTGGIMIGAQWEIGKFLCLDWWIVGPHLGANTSQLDGQTSVNLNNDEQQDVRDKLNKIDIPLLKKNVNVTSNKTTISFSGPWIGLRTGLSVGIRF